LRKRRYGSHVASAIHFVRLAVQHVHDC
jgi:hypothetical protein